MTEREKQILTLIGEGLSDREIGERLHIGHASTMRRVKDIRSQILADGYPLLPTRGSLVRYAIAHGYAPLR